MTALLWNDKVHKVELQGDTRLSHNENKISLSSMLKHRMHITCKASPIEVNEIDQAAHVFLVEEDGRKSWKSQKSGHTEKDATGNIKLSTKLVMDQTAKASKAGKRKIKQNPTFEVEDMEIDDGSTLMDIETHADSRIEMIDSDDEIPFLKATKRKGKVKAIVISDDESQSGHPTSKNRDTKRSDNASFPVNAQHEEVNFPSTFEDWDEWTAIAFQKANSQMFLMLGTWMLLQFRQLAKIPIDTLAHIHSHPEYLMHLFHKLGKSSSAGQLKSSHHPASARTTYTYSEQYPWLEFNVSERPVDEHDQDADGDVNDCEDDIKILDHVVDIDDLDIDHAGALISMVLNDMELSGPTDAGEILDGLDS
ncbi:hypothetical protein BDR04DRAFT_1123453 [Suillus decipiens]|nr:hypothetical protein BDR04DRAFT_1123453 [Suillus decipiens]